MFSWLEIMAMCCSAMLFGFLLGSIVTELYMLKKFSDDKPIDLTPKGKE